jgi:hypothetical protein
MGATGKSGAKAKAGLVRAIMADKGWEADARHWAGWVSREYRLLLLQAGEEKTREVVNEEGERVMEVVRKGMPARGREKGPVCCQEGLKQVVPATGHVALSQMLRWKVRYFTDGAAIGSRAFVDGLFEQCRERFGTKRKSGARKMRGRAAGAADALWSARDLRTGLE